MSLEDFLDFFGVHLFASSINTDTASAQQCDGAVGGHLTPVAGNGIAHAVNLGEGFCGFLRILIVAPGYAATASHKARFVAAGQNFSVVLRKYSSELADGEFSDRNALVSGGNRLAEADGF